MNIGASDAWLSASDRSRNTLGCSTFRSRCAAVMVNYNLPGVKSLNLNGTVLAEIYTGKITTWNDPAIAALNPGAKLPSPKIVTLHRADSSGATFLFASYLNAQDPSLWPSERRRHHHHLAVRARRSGRDRQRRHGDRVRRHQGLHRLHREQLPGQDHAAGLGAAALANKAGKFTQATPAAISAALASFPTAPASGAESLINTSAPTGYGIINYEYAIVKKTQPSAAEASAIKAFLSWILTTGDSSKYLSATERRCRRQHSPVSQSLVSSSSAADLAAASALTAVPGGGAATRPSAGSAPRCAQACATATWDPLARPRRCGGAVALAPAGSGRGSSSRQSRRVQVQRPEFLHQY